MKKSLKRFLIISQVLAWSVLLASACTDEQVKTISQSITTNNKENRSKSDSLNSSKKEADTTKQPQEQTSNHQKDEMSGSTQSSNTGSKTAKDSSTAHSEDTTSHGNTNPESVENQGKGVSSGGQNQSLQRSEDTSDPHGSGGGTSVPSKTAQMPQKEMEKENKEGQKQGTKSPAGTVAKPNAPKGVESESTQSGVLTGQETAKGKSKSAGDNVQDPGPGTGPSVTPGHEQESGTSATASHKATSKGTKSKATKAHLNK